MSIINQLSPRDQHSSHQELPVQYLYNQHNQGFTFENQVKTFQGIIVKIIR